MSNIPKLYKKNKDSQNCPVRCEHTWAPLEKTKKHPLEVSGPETDTITVSDFIIHGLYF